MRGSGLCCASRTYGRSETLPSHAVRSEAAISSSVPPSGAVCGIYARNDINRGVYKAPANEVGETALGLEKAVAALPDGARRVLVLHDVVGYRYEEVARLLGIAVGTVKAQLHRARKLVMEAVGR